MRRVGWLPPARWLVAATALVGSTFIMVGTGQAASGSPAPQAVSDPRAAVVADPTSGAAPFVVNFDAANSWDNGGELTSWSLSFGDGSPATAGTGTPPAIIPHVYADPGTFTSTLKVTDAGGLSAKASTKVSALSSAPTDWGARGAITIPVTGGPIAGLSTTPVALTPTFSATDTDYVWYCANGTNNLDLTLTSPDVISAGGKSGTQISLPIAVTNNQAVVLDVGSKSYWIRCLPATFPQLSVTGHGKTIPGYYLSGTLPIPTKNIPGYAFILNGLGTPVWYMTNLPASSGKDVELLPGTHTVAWSNGGPYSLFDLDTQTTSWIAPPVDPPDPHELFTDQTGNHWMISTPALTGYNLTSEGYPDIDDIADCVVQELNPQGQLVWSWDASKYVSPDEAESVMESVANREGVKVLDSYHCNAIDVDPQNPNNILISFRNVGVFLVHKDTGAIVWKLGGTSVPPMSGEPVLRITGDPEVTIQGQHDARFQPNGQISIFDDHTGLPGAARGVKYAIDRATETATMVWEYANPSGHASGFLGSTRRYDASGNTYDEKGSSFTGTVETVIDWGGGYPVSGFTVVDDSGNVLFSVAPPSGVLANRTDFVPLSALSLSELHDSAGDPFPGNS